MDIKTPMLDMLEAKTDEAITQVGQMNRDVAAIEQAVRVEPMLLASTLQMIGDLGWETSFVPTLGLYSDSLSLQIPHEFQQGATAVIDQARASSKPYVATFQSSAQAIEVRAYPSDGAFILLCSKLSPPSPMLCIEPPPLY